MAQQMAQELNPEVIDDIRDFVGTQSDLVQQTVKKLTNEKSITRYIHLLIYNIVEYCLMQLSEEAAELMINQITETLLHSLSTKQSSRMQLSSIFDIAPQQQIINKPPFQHPLYSNVRSNSPSSNSIFLSSGAAPESNHGGMLAEVSAQVAKQSASLSQIQTQLGQLQQEISQVKSGVSLAIENKKEAIQVKDLHKLMRETLNVVSSISLKAKFSPDNAASFQSAKAPSSPAHKILRISSAITQQTNQQTTSRSPLLKKVDSTSSNVSGGNGCRSMQVAQKSFESPNSSFVGNLADQNYNSSSDGDDENDLAKQEERKSISGGSATYNERNLSSLPDMWNHTDSKRSDGYFIFGAPKTSGEALQPIPVSKMSNAELHQRLKRQVQVQCSESIINWTCPFISSGTAYDSGLIFSRGKGNKLHVYNQELSTVIVKETSGHGLFSCRVHEGLAWIGCYDGHLFVFDINTFEKKDYKKLQQGIYDIQLFEDEQNGVKEQFLIFGQHFGHVDIINVETMRKVLQTKPLKVNTIFNIIMTTRSMEICFCGYNGMFFGKLKRDPAKGTFELLMSLTEVYFADRYVSRGIEYQPDKFVVCIQDDEQFFMIDRLKKQVTARISWGIPTGCANSFNFEIYKMPGFHPKRFPFLLMRDDYGIKVFNVQNTRRGVIRVKDAFYGSQAGYKTLDIITMPNANSAEFEVVYLETGETDAPNNATTTINRLTFTAGFMNTLKQLLQ